MTKWPMVPLGEVITQDSTATPVHADREYPNFGIYSFGRGLFAKLPISGATTSASNLYQVQAGQFIYSRLFAFEGAYGLVGEEFDGHFISNEYPHFNCDSKRIRSDYLATYFRWQKAWEKAATLSTGMGDRRRRVQPEQLLKTLIPLPPLREQQQLVEYLDALTARIDEAKRLREEADAKRSILLSRASATIFVPTRWPTIPLVDLLTEDTRNGLGVKPSDSPPGVPILRISAGTSRLDGTVDESDCKYLQITERELDTYRLRKGDLLACRFNGNLHYVGKFTVFQQDQPEDRVYPDKLIRFRVDSTKVIPEFVCYAMNSPAGREAVEAFCTTTAGNIGISAKELKTIHVPVPSIAEQRQIVAHLKTIQDQIKRFIEDAQPIKQEIDAMLPAILAQAFNGGSE